jgi:hypothetical protein
MSERVAKEDTKTVSDMKNAYQKYLEENGIIEKCKYNSNKETCQTIGNINGKPPELLTLAEGFDLFGKKKNRKTKTKTINTEDLKDINCNVLTGSAKELFDKIILEANNGGIK